MRKKKRKELHVVNRYSDEYDRWHQENKETSTDKSDPRNAKRHS